MLEVTVNVDGEELRGDPRWGVRLHTRKGGLEGWHGGSWKCVLPPSLVGARVVEKGEKDASNHCKDQEQEVDEKWEDEIDEQQESRG